MRAGKPSFPPSDPARPSRGRSRLWGISTFVVTAATASFYLWTASSNNNQFQLTGEQHDYYNLLSHGFLDGHLAMKVGPLPAADVAAREASKTGVPGLGDMPYLLDASFYQGKYYLYFGPTPVLTAFLPYRWLTGQDISDNLVAALFAIGGYLVSMLLLGLVRRRYFPHAPGWLAPLFAALLGLGNVCAVMLRHPLFYEAAIAAAFFFESLFLLGLYLALTAKTRRSCIAWLIFGSFACGLGVGARASYAFGSLAVVPAVVWLWRKREEGRALASRSLLPLVLAAFGPLALCAAGLMIYNYQRFGSVLEFGVKYQFTYRPVFSPRFIPFNLKLYYFSLPQWSWYFPFVMPIDEGVRPPGYVGFEHIHGQAWSAVLWLPAAMAAVLLWLRRTLPERPLAVLYTCAAFAYLHNLTILLCLGGRANRYLVDFQPTLMLLAAIGILVCEREVPGRRWLRRCAGGALAVVVLFIGLHNILASIQLYELLKQSNPSTYDKIATAMNAPTRWAGPWLYPKLGPVHLHVRFPPRNLGELEPLVVTGSTEYCDFLGMRYVGEGTVRFEMIHQGYPEIISGPVPVVAGRLYDLEIDLGSLYPPMAHPAFQPFARGERRLITRAVRVTLGGRAVFSARHDFYDASPDRVYVGKNPLAPLFSQARFTGTIVSSERLGLAPMLARKAAQADGALRLHLWFPPELAGRVPEPLVVTGTAGRGDAIFVSYEGPRHVRFGLDHWGGGVTLSDPVEIDPRVPHVVEISMGSLFPRRSGPGVSSLSPFQLAQLESTARVKLDGSEVLNVHSPFHAADPSTVDLGSNAIGMSTCSGFFSGEILDYDRLPPAEVSQSREPTVPLGPARLTLTFPTGKTGRREPVMATGAAGRGDVVVVEYLDEHHVRFAWAHTGAPEIFSEPVPLDYQREHSVEIEAGSLYPAEALAELPPSEVSRARNLKRHLHLRLDGHEVFSAESDFYAAAPAELEIGANRIGVQGCDPVFTGVVERVDRAGFGLAAGSARSLDYGPVFLELSFPRHRTGQAEPLLVTGHSGAGDGLIVSYIDERHIKLTWDHWGKGGPSSEIIPIDFGEWYLLKIELGSLYPENSPTLEAALAPEEIRRRRRVLSVTLDGQEVFSGHGSFYPAQSGEVSIGSNAIGLSSATSSFTGSIERARRPGVDAVVK